MKGVSLSVAASATVIISAPTETQIVDGAVTYNLGAARQAKQYADGSWVVQIPSGSNTQITSTVTASLSASGTFDGGAAYTSEVLHGMMQNPAQGTSGIQTIDHGFQSFETGDYAGMASTLQPYDAALNVDPGIGGTLTVTSPTTLVKTITDATPPDNGRDDIVTDMSYLTLVTSLPVDDAFRPSPRATDKVSYFTLADMDISFLPSHTAPASLPTYATLLGYVEKPLQTCYTNNLSCRNVNPANHQPGYGRDIANNLSDVMLALCTDGLTTLEKTTLMTHVVQLGLDIINNAIDGATWGPSNGSFGGGQHWVKAAAIIAAHSLRNASNSTKAAELLARVNPDQFKFTSEDRVFTYIGRTEIESFPDQRAGFDHIDFKDYMENSPMWNSKPSAPAFAGAAFDHVYRTIVWSGTIGQLLSLRLMGIEGYYTPAARDYLDFIWDWSKLQTPASAPNWVRPLTDDMLDNHIATASANYADTATPSVVRTVARGSYVWFEFDKLLSKGAIPAASAFAVTVAGSSATVESAADDFSDIDAGFEFESPNVYGYSLAVRLATPIAEGEAVTLAYTQPGSNAAGTLGGAAVPTIAATTATNQTGLLPDPIVSPVTFNGEGVSGDTDRQYSGTNTLPPETIDWLQLSARFQLHSLTTNDTFISAQANSTSLFWMYVPSGTNCRFYFGRTSANRVDFSLATLPFDTDITMHAYIDYSQADEANAVKIYFEWDGGSYEPVIASAVRTPDTPTLANLFNNGFYVGGILGSTTRQADMSHTGYLLRFGMGSTPALPAWANATFDWDADWGGNGENVWGEPDYYWAAEDINEANGSILNRGNNGALPMTPKLIDIESEDLVTPYVVVT